MKKVIKYIEDILILSGLGLIACTTFFINVYAGCYVTGTVLLGLGLFFAKYPLRR